VLKGERNKTLGDTEGENNIAFLEGVDACNDVKESYDTVVAIATGYDSLV
jgi:hypothetical protein